MFSFLKKQGRDAGVLVKKVYELGLSLFDRYGIIEIAFTIGLYGIKDGELVDVELLDCQLSVVDTVKRTADFGLVCARCKHKSSCRDKNCPICFHKR